MKRKNNLRFSANWKHKFKLGSSSNNNKNINISNNKFKSRPNSNKLILKKIFLLIIIRNLKMKNFLKGF